jgi:hypothetical protein
MIDKKIFIFGVLMISLVGILALVLADSYQNELSQLEQELIDSGFEWLVNYSGEDLYPKVEVYEKDGNEVLAVFNLTRYNESAFNEYKIFLTALDEGHSQDVFEDGKIVPFEIWMKKLRLEELRVHAKDEI